MRVKTQAMTLTPLFGKGCGTSTSWQRSESSPDLPAWMPSHHALPKNQRSKHIWYLPCVWLVPWKYFACPHTVWNSQRGVEQLSKLSHGLGDKFWGFYWSCISVHHQWHHSRLGNFFCHSLAYLVQPESDGTWVNLITSHPNMGNC